MNQPRIKLRPGSPTEISLRPRWQALVKVGLGVPVIVLIVFLLIMPIFYRLLPEQTGGFGKFREDFRAAAMALPMVPLLLAAHFLAVRSRRWHATRLGITIYRGSLLKKSIAWDSVTELHAIGFGLSLVARERTRSFYLTYVEREQAQALMALWKAECATRAVARQSAVSGFEPPIL